MNLEHLNPLNAVLESLSYTYDANGNRTKINRPGVPVELPNPASNINYNSANQMLTFNDKNIVYDNNGNMTTVTNSCGTTAYTWDARNRLAGIEGFDSNCQQLSASFNYDARGRRIQKTITDTVNGTRTTEYLYDSMDIIQEIENGVVTVNYIRTLNIDEPFARIEIDGTVRFYHADALGSVIALTDESSVVKTAYNYDPYGNTSVIGEASDNPFQYTGRENDGTGLYYYRARYYSPELQRFISEDPIGLAGGINFYAYVENNPVNNKDPRGLSSREPPMCKVCTKWRGKAYWGFNVKCRCCFICIPEEGLIFDSFLNGICVWGDVGNSKGYVGRHDVCFCSDPDGGFHEIPF